MLYNLNFQNCIVIKFCIGLHELEKNASFQGLEKFNGRVALRNRPDG